MSNTTQQRISAQDSAQMIDGNILYARAQVSEAIKSLEIAVGNIERYESDSESKTAPIVRMIEVLSATNVYMDKINEPWESEVLTRS